MRLNFTIIFNLIFFFSLNSFSNISFAQYSTTNNKNKNNSHTKNITGVWRGYFIQREFDLLTKKFHEERYKYEVQINNTQTSKLQGVTYSYLDKRFYGKTALHGIFTVKSNNVLIKESKMLELKMTGNSEPCLMTCYLTYSKIGDKEILKGDYSSTINSSKSDCGEGIVYLEKVPDSDFGKEDFLVNKPNSSLSKSSKNSSPNKKINSAKLKYKPGAEDALVTNNKPIIKKEATPKLVDKIEKKESNQPTAPLEKIEKIEKPITPLPKVLTERKNNLVKTFYVGEGEISLELYDNGQIDNDIVSIYHNGVPVIQNERLSTIPIKLNIKITASEPVQEFIIVAESLGEIPPNSSLLKIKAGNKTYQVFLTSDLQKNAKIVFEYKPQNEDSQTPKK